jgi:hypothetical protein
VQQKYLENDLIVREHPEKKAADKKGKLDWLKEHGVRPRLHLDGASVTQAHKCLALLDGQDLLKEWLVLTKTYVPANILKCSTEDLEHHGLSKDLASRVKKMMILRIIWMDKKRKLAIHAGDITKYVLMTHQGGNEAGTDSPLDPARLDYTVLDLVELSAVYASLPEPEEYRGQKVKQREWCAGVFAHLKQLFQQQAEGTLPPEVARNPLYPDMDAGPFHPDDEPPPPELVTSESTREQELEMIRKRAAAKAAGDSIPQAPSAGAPDGEEGKVADAGTERTSKDEIYKKYGGKGPSGFKRSSAKKAPEAKAETEASTGTEARPAPPRPPFLASIDSRGKTAPVGEEGGGVAVGSGGGEAKPAPPRSAFLASIRSRGETAPIGEEGGGVAVGSGGGEAKPACRKAALRAKLRSLGGGGGGAGGPQKNLSLVAELKLKRAQHNQPDKSSGAKEPAGGGRGGGWRGWGQ